MNQIYIHIYSIIATNNLLQPLSICIQPRTTPSSQPTTQTTLCPCPSPWPYPPTPSFAALPLLPPLSSTSIPVHMCNNLRMCNPSSPPLPYTTSPSPATTFLPMPSHLSGQNQTLSSQLLLPYD